MAKTAQRRRGVTGQAKSRIPQFKTIEEEAAFWDTHSTTEFEGDFEEVTDVKFVLVKARPKKTITVRLAEDSLASLSQQAEDQGVGPSTLARTWILERLLQRDDERSRT